jgi:alkanesulfonate monooxygenase
MRPRDSREEKTMSIEFAISVSGPGSLYSPKLSRGLLTDLAAAVELAGINRLLLTDDQGMRDVAALASYMLHATVVLGIDVEHRVGTLAPEIAARQLATLDQLSGGRLGVHVVPQDADGLSHEENVAKLDEYLVLLKRLWSNDGPIDHEGRFFRLLAAFSGTKPFNAGALPLALSGASGTAVKIAARHADRFVLAAASLEEARRMIERVKVAAASYGRANAIRFALPIRLARNAAEVSDAGTVWAVGSPERIALTLLDYADAGVTDFVVDGLGTPSEVAAFGERVVPLVRRTLAHRAGHAPEQFLRDSAGVAFPRWSGRAA